MGVKRHKSSTLHTALMTVGCAFALHFQSPWTAVSAANSDGEIQMQVRPRLCVLAPGESLCTMQFAVTWTASIATDVCLKIAGEIAPLQCWEAQRAGQFELSLARRATTVVELRDANSDVLLLEEQIPIISRDLRDTRTRRRHVWSIL